jgi:hypothetical protein
MNGTFGVGKTTTATHLVAKSDRLRLFDPESVGYLLMHNLADYEFTDFQQLPPWRALVPVVADEIFSFTKQDLVAVQTVLHQEYWNELRDGLRARGHEVLHVLLDAAPDTLHARIDSDPEGHDIRKWRHEHVETFMTERPWLVASADIVVDTSSADAESAATAVFHRIQGVTVPA